MSEKSIFSAVEVGGLKDTPGVVGPAHISMPIASLLMSKPRQLDFDSFFVLLRPLAELRLFVDCGVTRAC